MVWLALAAHAQPSEQVESVEARAQDFHASGAQRFAEGRYDEAIALWRAGYDLVPRRGFLFNIASAYERLHELDAAIEVLLAYRAASPLDEHTTLDQRIAGLRARQRATMEPARKRVRPGTVAVGAGVVALTVGTVLAVSSYRQRQRGLDFCAPTGLCTRGAQVHQDASTGQAVAAGAAWLVGGGLVVGGALALRPRGDAVAVRMEVGPRLAAHLQWSWSVR